MVSGLIAVVQKALGQAAGFAVQLHLLATTGLIGFVVPHVVVIALGAIGDPQLAPVLTSIQRFLVRVLVIVCALLLATIVFTALS